MSVSMPFPLDKHLFLIGYRGSGKTSVARELARYYNCASVDTDATVEQSAGMSIRDIFSVDGESKFRDLETAALRSLEPLAPSIVSLGGGMVLRDENRDFLKEHGHCVWLQASPEDLYRRIQADTATQSQRPALSQLSGYDEIVQILGRREPLYRELAENIVQTENLTPDNVAKRIIAWIETLTK